MRSTLMNGARNGSVSPEQAVNFLIPAEQRGEAVKELKEAQEMNKARDNALTAFNQVSNLATFAEKGTHPIDNPRQIHALTSPITAALSKATAGRFTEQDAGMLESLWPLRGDSDKTREIKRIQMDKLISEKMNFPTLKAWGLDPAQWSRYNAQGQNRIPQSAPVINKK